MFGIFVVWTVDMFCSDEIAEWSCSVAPVVMVMSGLVQRSVRFMSNGPGCKCGASSWMAEAAVSISGVREAGLGGGRDWAATQSQQRLSRAHNELWGWEGPFRVVPAQGRSWALVRPPNSERLLRADHPRQRWDLRGGSSFVAEVTPENNQHLLGTASLSLMHMCPGRKQDPEAPRLYQSSHWGNEGIHTVHSPPAP